MSKTRASCFIRGSKHLETIKALGLRPRAFICFSVFGTPDQTLALVFDILLEQLGPVQYVCISLSCDILSLETSSIVQTVEEFRFTD